MRETINDILLICIMWLAVLAILNFNKYNQPPVGDIPLQQTCFTETNFKDGAFRLSNELK